MQMSIFQTQIAKINQNMYLLQDKETVMEQFPLLQFGELRFRMVEAASKPDMVAITMRMPSWCLRPPAKWLAALQKHNSAGRVPDDQAFPTTDINGQPLEEMTLLATRDVSLHPIY